MAEFDRNQFVTKLPRRASDSVQPPQFVPLIWPFFTNVSGTGARMPSA